MKFSQQVNAKNQLSLRQVWSQKDLLKQEIIAGLTGFFAISYIIIVNPVILKDAGIPTDLSVFATIISSVVGCLIMGFFANSPIILTPGMGVNAFFTYTIVVTMGMSWQVAVAISMVASVVYMIVAFTKLADVLAEAIPGSLKSGITAGIGLFLVEIGLEKAGLIVRGKSSLIELGNLTSPACLLALFGLLLSVILYQRNVTGGFLIGIVVTTIIGILFGIRDSDSISVKLSELSQYHNIVLKGDFSHALSIPFILAAFSMTMILVFESMGLLQGVLPDKRKFKKSFQASSVTAFLSGMLGTSPTVAAAESASGIESGGRTGIMSITAGILFAISLFFTPLLSYVPQAAIAPVIIITGAIMMESIGNIDMSDFAAWFPAFLIVVLIPMTNSISTGLAFGFVFYPILRVVSGDGRSVRGPMYLLGALFLIDLVLTAIL
ncbi:permease [Secundilactobacillus paracollinoides]|uniref:NCS2 family permease n=1 Tax=Secundilactobacillus paracollinoides TaxID=240427 RepID=UPI0006D2C82F|nr:NCS2 family permease [Secundilactobacillus paracollinoides]ANZ62868.1 permease [Secundilactobacillus paracollinoides]KRL78447.1 xanthine uracil vitamin C permease [Secundilactobacillus paracollinoides DSM 15502 = JCM 11969]